MEIPVKIELERNIKMAESKYGKYIIREPLEKGRAGPMLHICAEKGCLGEQFPGFPIDVQMHCITEPKAFPLPYHSHDADEIFFVFGSDPKNYYDFDAEFEFYLGEEKEKHIINSTTITYLPKGLKHGLGGITRVNKPFQWMRIIFSPQYDIKYDMSSGEVAQHPRHPRAQYSPEEKEKLRGR
jgi:hypothetical protein